MAQPIIPTIMRRLFVVSFLLSGIFPPGHSGPVAQSQTRPSQVAVFFESQEEEVVTCSSNAARSGECLDAESCNSLADMFTEQVGLSNLRGTCANSWQVCCPLNEPSETTSATTTTAPCSNAECGLNFLHTRIIGGRIASKGAWPWMAMLIFRLDDGVPYPSCGGVLINEQFVLTAAHCVKTSDRIKLDTIRLGEHEYESDEDNEFVQDFRPADIIIHEDYKSFREGNDIALIKLDGKVILTERVRTICLPFGISMLSDNNTFVAGWGRTGRGNHDSHVLMQALVPIVSSTVCRNAYHNYSITSFETTICAGGDGKTDSCSGDSGGPLMWPDSSGRFFAIGIVSWGRGCATEGFPGIYSSVSHFLEWIDRTVKDRS